MSALVDDNGELVGCPHCHEAREECPIPYGDCHCGCGSKTVVSPYTDRSKNWVGGVPRKYIRGHANMTYGPDYLVEDCGYTTPCWIWQKSMQPNGYGVVWIDDRRRKQAHIAMYERHVGPVPDGLQLDHLCRVRPCVNPEHLEAVTQLENIRRGSRVKLTVDTVREVRALFAAGQTQAALAQRFGVHPGTVSNITTRKTWRDVA